MKHNSKKHSIQRRVLAEKPEKSGFFMQKNDILVSVRCIMEITVRKAVSEDLKDLLEIEASAIPGYAYLEEAKDFLLENRGNRGEMVLAEADGVPAGMGRYSVLPDGSGWLETLRVKKEYQHMGIGSAIYRRYLELAAETEAPSVAMFTGRRNIASRSLAEKNGFAIAADYTGFEAAPEQTDDVLPFHLITDPAEVRERIEPWRADWGPYLCFNRTFMKFSDDLYRWLAEKNFVWGTDEETTLVLGARMLEHRGLHIGFMCGDLSAALAFARNETAKRNLPSLQLMFRKGYADMEAFCAYHRMKLNGDLIVMERKMQGTVPEEV